MYIKYDVREPQPVNLLIPIFMDCVSSVSVLYRQPTNATNFRNMFGPLRLFQGVIYVQFQFMKALLARRLEIFLTVLYFNTSSILLQHDLCISTCI